jgi:glycosyltransferase involved in cell wall biosynthesis
MRVLHLAAGNLYGGVETLLTTLARQRHHAPALEPHYALCFPGRLADELTAAGVPVYHVGAARFSRPWTVWGARRRLRAVLDRERPDLVVSHECWPHALFAPVVRSCRLPLVFWVHDVHTGRHWLERWARRHPPDLALANSRLTWATLANLFPNVPGEVLYLPVAATDLPDRGHNRRQVREVLHTPDSATVIIQASRLERWKGHAELLRALAQLADVPGWVCWIAGGPQQPREQAYLEELRGETAGLALTGRVRFLGQRTDVPQLLAAADIHCQPNTGPEPFGIAFVEALYAGLPVVTTALGGALEIVTDACGCLVPPGRSEDLAVALRRLLTDPGLRQRQGGAGPARARELCDPDKQLPALGGVLQKVRGHAPC